MSLYLYIAESNPDACVMLLHKYGYANQQLNSIEDVATATQGMVAAEGEPAFKDLLKLHPDKDVIVEQFSPAQVPVKAFVGCDGSSGCGGGCGGNHKNASGDANQTANIATQTNTFILLGAVIVAVAILTSSK